MNALLFFSSTGACGFLAAASFLSLGGFAEVHAQDVTPPTVLAMTPSPGANVGSLSEIRVTFSEPVTPVSAADLLINGIPARAVGGAGGETTYVFAVSELPSIGPVRIEWDPSHTIRDRSPAAHRFDETGPGATWTFTLFDGIAPQLANLSPPAGAGIRSLGQIEVTFTEAVAGVNPADLLMNGLPASHLDVLGPGRYRFSFPAPEAGMVTAGWANDHGIHDLAAQPNVFSGGAWTYTLDPNLGVPAVRINELNAANVSGLRDEDGEAEDWIELWNYGSAEVNLAGYSLTDDPEDPRRWTFPSTNLVPGQFLVVFASGKDRKAPVTSALRLHTNFKLGPGGEYLGLYTADVPPVVVTEFAPGYPDQRNDHSYGLDDAGERRYFASPTPGGPNGASLLGSALSPPHFNVARGRFDRPFVLELSHPIYGVTIRYTTDGSEPSPIHGLVYYTPLTISNTAAIRAAAFRNGRLPSVTVTHTYLFPGQTLRQPANPPGFPAGPTVMGGYPADYEMDPEIVTATAFTNSMLNALGALPSVSMVMSTDHLFGPTNGIYTHVVESTTQFRGVAWERPCSIEFLPADGGAGFTINCGVRMQGNASRNPQKTPKHPFRLLFKNDYGPGRLEAEVFPDSPVRSFNTLVLRADFNNSWLHWNHDQRSRGTRIRDGWTKDTWRAMGQPGSHTRYVHLYLNGLYWGIYDFGERIDATLAANYLGGEPEDYDAIASKPVNAVDGDLVAYNAMVSAVRSRPQNVLSNYQAALALLEVENFADYMLLNFYGGNQDWGNDSNWNAVRRRQPGGRFKFISWDGEQLIVNVNDNRVASSDVPAGLHTSLVASPEYRLTFADRAHRHLFNHGALSTNAVAQRWRDRAHLLTNAILAESARWGDYRRDVHSYQTGPYILYTRDTGTTNWLAEINRLLNSYFPQRGSILLAQLQAAGLYPTVQAPVFNHPGGAVPHGFNLTASAAQPVYLSLDGSDPRVFGSGAIAPTAFLVTGPVALQRSVLVKARTLSGTNWSALQETSFTVAAPVTPLRVTEIMYNPPAGDAYEYLELRNVGPAPLDVSRFTIDAIGYVFPPNTFLAPDQIVVLASAINPANWAARYPHPAATPFGSFNGKLDNGGEKIELRHADGTAFWSVDYDDEGGWPTEADGLGASLEIVDALGNPDDPANWRPSAGRTGSPGSIPPPPDAGSIVIHEIMADNLSAVPHGGAFPDWVELFNPGAVARDLSGWSLTDDSLPRKFVFPPGTTLAAGEHLVIWCDTNSTAPGLHAGFSLDREGEALFLHDAATNRVDQIGFGLQLPDLSIGRTPNGWALTQPTPGSPNSPAALAAAGSLTLNEWLANAVPGGDDWIELHNRAAAPAALGGVHLSASGNESVVPALSFVAPHGFVQLLADGNRGARHLDFKLPAEGATLVLSTADGTELERVVYGAQLQNISAGRLPDGSSNIVGFPGSSSPGASNFLAVYGGPRFSEVLAINRTGVTNAAGRTADYVEIQNTNSSPFDLSGYRLGNDPAGANPWTWLIPAGTLVPGLGHGVVWFDDETPASTTASPTLNTGRSLDGESDEVWLFSPAGQPLDSIVFGLQIADRSLGLAPEGTWHLQGTLTPGGPNAGPAVLGDPSALRFNEWLASSPNSPDETDWFELHNASDLPVSLAGLLASDRPGLDTSAFPLPSLSFIGARGFAHLHADGHPSRGRNHVNFSLDGEGESLVLTHPDRRPIDVLSFGPQTPGVSEGRLPDGGTAIARFPLSPTPGASNYDPIPDLVINEVLTQSDNPGGNAIEIRNLSGTPRNLAGWYLSNDPANFRMFRIPAGTVVPGNGWAVFTQAQFNGGPGSITPFTLDSAAPGMIWLTETASDQPTGRRAQAAYGPTDPGVPVGRYLTTAGTDHPALLQSTLGAENAAPRIGPIVINEIHYHPPGTGGAGENPADEFVELYNSGPSAAPLFATDAPAKTWRLRGDIDFDFPAGTLLAPHSYLLLVPFNPSQEPALAAAFRARHGLPAFATILGPYQGQLNNGGGRLSLQKPHAEGASPLARYVEVDSLQFDDAAPWPDAANGSGPSLQRRRPFAYGNEPANWKADGATAGRANVPGSTFADADADGLPDAWELAHGFSAAQASDADQDADGDGNSNREEYFDGTDPRLGTSRMLAPTIQIQPVDQILQAGTAGQLTVSSTGSAPLVHQWRHNGALLPGATGPMLAFEAIEPAQAGEYTVSIANPAGYAISRTVRVTVSIPPVIVLQPLSQIIASNGTATLTVGAVGSGQLRYQWQFNGSDLPRATNDSLAISGATLAHEGEYRAIVSDERTTISSDPARLTVRIVPRILIPPANATNNVGASVSFAVTASGSVPMSFQWRKGSLPLTNQILMTTNATFSLANLRTNDTGLYRVVITNFGGGGSTVTAQFYLQVIAPPVVLADPASTAVALGSNATFTVTAAGTAPLRYQWSFQGTPLAGATNTTLIVPAVRVSDQGDYRVTVTNPAGSALSGAARLTITDLPRLTDLTRLPSGGVQMNLSGPPNRSHEIEHSPDLSTWLLLRTIAYTNGSVPIMDATAPGLSNRFYRARVP